MITYGYLLPIIYAPQRNKKVGFVAFISSKKSIRFSNLNASMVLISAVSSQQQVLLHPKGHQMVAAGFEEGSSCVQDQAIVAWKHALAMRTLCSDSIILQRSDQKAGTKAESSGSTWLEGESVQYRPSKRRLVVDLDCGTRRFKFSVMYSTPADGGHGRMMLFEDCHRKSTRDQISWFQLQLHWGQILTQRSQISPRRGI